MFPQDYTMHWSFQLQLHNLACWRLTPPPPQSSQRLASLHWSQWNCNKIKSVLWTKRIEPIWQYVFNNPLIWYSSDPGKWHPIDGLIITMMWQANIHFCHTLDKSSGTWCLSAFIFDLIYLVSHDNKPRGKEKYIVNISISQPKYLYTHACEHICTNINPKPCSNHRVAATDEIYHPLKPLGMKKSTGESIPSRKSAGSCLLSTQPSSDGKKINAIVLRGFSWEKKKKKKKQHFNMALLYLPVPGQFSKGLQNNRMSLGSM